MKSVVQWLLRHGSLYVLLVLAVALAPFVVKAIQSGSLLGELMSPREVAAQVERLRGDAAQAFDRKAAAIHGLPASALRDRLRQAQAEMAVVSDGLRRRQGWFASVRPRLIVERKELELRQTALTGEIRLLQAALDGQAARSELQRLMAPTPGSIAAAKARCERANAEAERFNARPALDRTVRNVLADEARRLTREAQELCAQHQARLARRNAALARVQQLQGELAKADAAYAQARREARQAIFGVRIDLPRTVSSVLLTAAVLLAGIIAAPYLIRLGFYFILGPWAERRPQVRLPWPAGAAPSSLSLPRASATSAPITLRAGEELLVRQGFLQSTSSAGKKATRGLLDWRHPFSSLASGLAFLTRIEGEGETTTVSAVEDPFAEVAVLELPEGGACVLQPRALVAVAQPRARPLRITSHWRLGSLHAWLTLQLRYLMFHGPARLVVKGGRGVRVEHAERGRIFGQDQLVGFSAELAYSVTRTETFWPYFLGLEPLLKDRVEAGEGLLILEEAPLTAGGRAHRRQGLEGAADVLLKAVGL